MSAAPVTARPRRIAVVCYPSFGGSGVIAASLAGGLSKRGHQLHLLSTAPPTRASLGTPRLQFERISVTEYPLYEHSNYTVAVAGAIIDAVRRHSIELLHLHYAVPHAASALLARSILGPAMPKTLITLHGTDVTRAPEDASAQIVTRPAVEAADAITVPSAYLEREARAKLGISEQRSVLVMPNFVDTERFRPPDEGSAPRPGAPVRLVHVSNLRPVKRPLDLITAFERVRASRPAHLRVVGDGPGRLQLERVLRARGLAGEVELLGHVSDPAEILRGSDVFLLPSATESFGVAALEALASGVPVVAYRVGGVPEVVTEACGRLVAPHDPVALGDAVLEITRSAEHLEESRRVARERAISEFGIERALDRFETLLEQLLESRR